MSFSFFLKNVKQVLTFCDDGVDLKMNPALFFLSQLFFPLLLPSLPWFFLHSFIIVCPVRGLIPLLLKVIFVVFSYFFFLVFLSQLPVLFFKYVSLLSILPTFAGLFFVIPEMNQFMSSKKALKGAKYSGLSRKKAHTEREEGGEGAALLLIRRVEV